MKKQLLLFILMLLPLVVSAFTGETVIDDIKYYINTDDKTAEVRANSYSGDVVIPETVEYEGVTCDVISIGKYTFTGYSNLTSVTIGNSVTSIGNEAFKDCTGLTSVTIGNSVTSIGGNAFRGCSGLTSITIPNSVAAIGNNAFDGCRITSIYISDLAAWCAISYAKQTFQNFHLYLNGEEVVDLVIPNSMTSIGDYAFSGCTGLSSVTIPNSVTSIGDYAFSGCTGLSSVTIPNSVTNIGGYVFSGCTGLSSVTIPNSVTSIGESAFRGCSNLTSVTIPSSVTSIGGRAFGDCTSLTSITIPNSVTTIGWSAFENCTSLTSVTIPNSVTEISYSMFKGCYRLSSITIPNTVTSIGSEAFWDCNSLTSITIPSSVTSIGGYAFAIEDPISVYISDLTAWCTMQLGVWPFYGYHLYLNGQEVKELVIPNSMTRIGGYAFLGCHSLTSVTIPNSVTSIGENAFFGCTSLTSITIGSNVERIDGAFCYNCSNIKDVYCYAETVPSTDSWSFFSSSIFDSATLHVPDGSISDYSNTNPWSQFATIVGLGGTGTFEGEIVIDGINYYINSTDKTAEVIANSYSGEVFIPETVECAGGAFDVTSIGSAAFQGCSGLTSVTIPYSVTNIGQEAFEGCSALTNVKVNWETPLSIGESTFSNRSNATLFVPYGSKTAYEAADYWKEFMEIIEMGITFADANVKALCVQNWDTNGDGELSEAEAAAVTSLGQVFNGNNSITTFDELQYFTGLTNISDEAFRDCSALTSVTIPNSVISIGVGAFENCSGLTSITIPNSVTSIGVGAFEYCSGLTSITIPNSVTSIGDYAFRGCDNLTSIEIPNSVTSIGNSAFLYCVDLTSIIVDSGNSKYDSRNSCNAIIETASNTLIAGCKNTTIPNSVTSIGDYAFSDCSGLTSIIIPNSVTSIGYAAFQRCYGLTSIIIPNSVTSIGTFAFYNCFGLTSIDIPASVTSIEDYAFYRCDGLTSITIPNSVTSIGGNAFSRCSSLTSIEIPNSVTSIGNSAFLGCVDLTSIIVDSGNSKYDSRNSCNAIIETASNTLIAGCKNTTIPNSVTSIGDYAFSDCSGLTSIIIPNSVTSIGTFAFSGCSSLTSVKVDWKTPLSISSRTFSNSRNITLYVPYGSKAAYKAANYWNEFKEIFEGDPFITFADSNVKDICIANWDTDGDEELSKVEAAMVTSLEQVFKGNSSITTFNELQYFTELTSIDDEAFSDCSGLTSIIIPCSVTSIGSAAFQGCSGLTSVTIPYSVTDIGSSAFEGCSALTNVKVDWETPVSISSTTFTNRANITLYVPAGSKAAYQAADYWKDFKRIIECIDGDVNGDGESDVLDVVDIARYVVGTAAETFVPILADINSDGEVNIADAVCLVNDIAGDQNFAKPMRAPRKPETASDALMLTKGSNGLSLLLENQRDYTAFQFDLYVPEGVDVMQMMLNAQRKQKHQLLYNEVEEGHWRVAALSTSNRTFADNSGELLSFTLAGNANGDIVVSDIHFFTPNGNDYAFYDIQMKVGVATDIQSAGNPLQTTDHPNVYDLSGRKIENSKWSNRQLPKGIYIVNGKKVVIK